MIREPFISTLQKEEDFIGKASTIKTFAISPDELAFQVLIRSISFSV